MRRALARALVRALLTPSTPVGMLARHTPARSAGCRGLARPAFSPQHARPAIAARAASSSSSSAKAKVVYECAACGVQLAQKKGCCPECGSWGR
mgnify:CR=1 FL=1